MCASKLHWLRRIACLLAAAGSPSAADPAAEGGRDPVDEPSSRPVNGGELVFLERPPEKGAHRQDNHVVIRESSLVDGWVELRQCHERLDRVPRSQVVFNKDRARAITVTVAEGIGEVWVEGNTVQVKDTRDGARLCIGAETRALEALAAGGFQLRNGPFMRRFLDGYYPMAVTMRVTLATPRVRFEGIDPAPQTGLRVWEQPGEIFYHALFEGRLVTRIFLKTFP